MDRKNAIVAGVLFFGGCAHEVPPPIEVQCRDLRAPAMLVGRIVKVLGSVSTAGENLTLGVGDGNGCEVTIPLIWAPGAKPPSADWDQYSLMKPGQPGPANPPVKVADPHHFGTVIGTVTKRRSGASEIMVFAAKKYQEWHEPPVD